MFITVLHGENKADIFNIHCRIQLLLDAIKHRCDCEEEDEIELADEHGQIKNLTQNKHRTAADLLGERETYVLIGMARGEKPSQIEFSPLLKNDNIINPKFLAKLGNWQERKVPSPKMKSRKTHKKTLLDIAATEGLRNHSPHSSRVRTPNASPKQSKKF